MHTVEGGANLPRRKQESKAGAMHWTSASDWKGVDSLQNMECKFQEISRLAIAWHCSSEQGGNSPGNFH
jgi:hypothetical protein